MNKPLINRTLHFLALIGLCLAQGIAHADDTEIYFSSGSTTGNTGEVIRPNVLFILDTSGSMTDRIPEAGGATRVDVMKDAVKRVLEDVEDINVGLMRYTNNDGGPVLFPISYIDGNVAEVVGENAGVAALSYEAVINDGANDGEENLTTNSVVLGETTLEFVEIGASTAITATTQYLDYEINDDDRDAEEDICGNNRGDVDDGSNDLDFVPCSLVGLSFNDVDDDTFIGGDNDIRNAIIKHAYLDFYVDDRRTNTTDVRIWGENADDPQDYFEDCNDSCDDISRRVLTSASVDWEGIAAGDDGDKISSIDIRNIVQEIVSRGCIFPPSAVPNTLGCTYGNDEMNFIIRTLTGRRDLISKDNNSNRETELRIEIETGTTTAVAGDRQLIGFRFDNIKIPYGATLTDASLLLTPSATDGTDNDTEWTIKAEYIGDSPDFTTIAGDFSSRTLTTAEARWDVPRWSDGVPVETTDNNGGDTLKSVLQEVVGHSDWCGGNAISLFITGATNSSLTQRESESAEGNSGTPPKLKYSFQSGASGCYAGSESAQVGVEGDDAEEDALGTTYITHTDLNLGVDTVGVRFQGIDVPYGATIIEADMLFTAQGVTAGAAAFTIKGELPADGNANIFTNTNNNISARDYTSGIAWVPEDWDTAGELFPTSDLTTIVQAMVNNANWEIGNAMVFAVEPGTGNRIADSNNSDPARAPRLRIRYEDTADTQFKTVRERLIEVIDDLPASGSTPIAETMYEAALYWRGEDVRFGLTRDGSRTSRISHPGSYCFYDTNGDLDCRGADVSDTAYNPDTNEFGVQNPSGCNPASNPNDWDCSGQNIKGDPTYISPFNSELTCQNNYQVLLTDGSANSNNASSIDLMEDMIGVNSCLANNSSIKIAGDINHTYSYSEECTVDLVKYMKENDQSTASVGTNLDNEQLVRTYTIAFNLNNSGDQQFLKDMANVGAGQAFTAVTAGQLVDVFTTILTDVKSDPTSFVSPSLATNAFNRLLSRDEVYFGLFTPALNMAWPGNVKKYNICIDSSTGCTLGSFLDANGDPAIDPADDKFRDTAQSIWSSGVDGRATVEGGSGGEITNYTETTLYTEVAQGVTATSSTPLSDAGYQLNSINWTATELADVRTAICPTPSVTGGSDCEDRMLWLLGKVITPDAATDISATQRWSTNDVLHSSPSVITYGGEDDNNNGIADEPEDSDGIISTFYDKIVVGTNDGSLHMINGYDGKEDWRFMPSNFLTQQQSLFTNPQTSHQYGLDITPTIYVKDVDSNGVIETGDGDFVKVYAGSRRGSKFLYALDVSADIGSKTEKVVPKFIWKIQGGVTSGYERMSYTWSQPRLADIATTSGVKKVLVFGGGYDVAQDDALNFSVADNGGNFLGNAIFIADPETGDKILSISGSGSGADIEISGMGYSIPSRIAIVDTNGDGIDDRLYVGDTGGQIWRVDLGTDIIAGGGLNASCLADTPPTCISTIVGKLASLSSTATAAGKRRFFEPPSVVQVRDAVYSDQSDYDYVLIGSGYRAHPLNTTVSDRFYAIRDRHISGLADDDGDHFSEIVDGYADGSGAAIVNSGLVNATSAVLDTSDATKQSDGWYFDFTAAGNSGEKVLSAANAVAGGVTFTTFRPGAASVANPCEGTLGNANAYNFDILNSNAFLDWDGDGDVDTSDRALSLGGGIPSDVVPVFTKEGVIGIVGIEGGASQLGVLSGLPRFRTYWYEE